MSKNSIAASAAEPLGKRLLITQIYDHQSNLSQSGVPLMVLDAWEHAYYGSVQFVSHIRLSELVVSIRSSGSSSLS
jgi:superoxide dismutase